MRAIFFTQSISSNADILTDTPINNVLPDINLAQSKGHIKLTTTSLYDVSLILKVGMMLFTAFCTLNGRWKLNSTQQLLRILPGMKICFIYCCIGHFSQI